MDPFREFIFKLRHRKSPKKSNAVYKFLDDDDLIKSTAKKLSEGNAVGWFQDRMEFGPRSLGSRSI